MANAFSLKLRLISLALVMGLAQSFSSCAFGQILLDINLSDPSAAVITATGTHAGAADSSTTSFDGTDLLTFFSGNVGFTNVADISGGLKVPGSQSYINAETDNSDEASYLDLNLYYGGKHPGPTTQTFATNSAAFTGQLVVNLEPYLAELPTTLGATGEIIAGDTTGDTVIGDWEVTHLPIVATPEPSTWTLMICGLGLLAFLRLRTRQNEKA